MRSLSGPKNPDKPADSILVHPDVRKMLLTAKAYARGGRVLSSTALLIDKELNHPDEAVRKECAEMVALLTPSSKALHHRHNGWISTPHRMQVFGGHGYIAEWAWSSSCGTPAST